MGNLCCVALLLTLGFALPSCAAVKAIGEQSDDPGAMRDLDAAADSFYGQSVTLNGLVIQVYSAQIFRIDNPDMLGGDDLLVLMLANDMALTEGQSVAVSGVLQMFDQSELEQTLGLEIGHVLGTALAGQTVIVAESVSRAASN